MPSFFAKVGLFSPKKKPEQPSASSTAATKAKKRHSASPSLIDKEKFESISKPTSPAAEEFAQNAQERAKAVKNKDAKSPLLRPKSPRFGAHGKEATNKDVPQLQLELPPIIQNGKQDSSLDSALGLRSDKPELLEWQALGEKRLTPEQALTLIQACAEVVKLRGTLASSYSMIF